MKVKVRLERTSVPIEFDADSVYQKGDFLCVATGGFQEVTKFPIDHVFMVVEEYGYTAPQQGPKDPGPPVHYKRRY